LAWEVVSTSLVALIFCCFYIAFNLNTENKKLIIFKVFFLWFGFTLVMPFLQLSKYAVPAAETEAINIFTNLFLTYLPLYVFLNYIIFIVFFKDVLIFFRECVKNFGKGKDDLEEPDLY
jgi:Na+/phosphate symporter